MDTIQEINSLKVNPDPNDPEQFSLELGYIDASGNQRTVKMRMSDGLFLWNLLGAALANYNNDAIIQRVKDVYSKHPVEIRLPLP